MFIYFVDLVESRIFFWVLVKFFGFCGQRWVPPHRTAVHLHSVWRPCVLLGAFAFFLVWILAEVCLPWRYQVDSFSLGWNFTRGRSQKRSQRSTTVAAVVVCNIWHDDLRTSQWKAGEIWGTKPSGIRPNFSWGTGKGLERKSSVWCAVDTSPWVGMHTCTPQVASFDSTSDTKQWLCSTTQHDSLLWEHTVGFTVHGCER